MINPDKRYLKHTVISHPRDLNSRVVELNYLNAEQLKHEEVADFLKTNQNKVEDEEFFIIDNLQSESLRILVNLELNEELKGQLIDDKYPCFHEELTDKNYYESYPKVFKPDILLEDFEESSQNLFQEITAIVQRAFPAYHMRLIERTWRLYPICPQPLHIDEFDNPSDSQILRVFINLDVSPRVVTFSKHIWDIINSYPGENMDWPDSVRDCLKFFSKKYLTEKNLMRYNLDFKTVFLQSGAIWIGNPATVCHSGIQGYKALALDFEYKCDNLNHKEKSFRSRWEEQLKKKLY